MTGETKRKTMKWGALLPGIFLMSAVAAESLPAQEKQRQQNESHKQQQSEIMNRSPFPNDVLEDLLVIRLAERSNLTRAIEASVKEGVATLSGKVPDQEAERRALRIARNTPGIMSVRDEINIDKSMSRTISEMERKVNEKELVKQVAEKIAASIEGAKAGKDWWFEGWRVEGQFNTWNLVVEVDEPGFVMLDGEVPSLDIMRNAVEAAAQVPGVRSVDTDLELERFYTGYYYPYGYFPYSFGRPYPWHPAIPHGPMPQDERQAASTRDRQEEGR